MPEREDINICGVYGFIGKPTKKTRKAIFMLALLNQARGTHSTGVAVVQKDAHYLEKSAVPASHFFGKHAILNKIPKYKDTPTVVMGHTRHATMGEINDKNAHPFIIDEYLFTHNGSISNTFELKKKYKIDYEVDSQYIGHLLNKKNHKNIFSKKLSGWWAVPYVKMDDPLTLNIARSTAPLHFSHTEHGMYYSSEEEHLIGGLKYAKIRYKNIVCMKNNSINTFKISGIKIKHNREDYEKVNVFHYGYQGYRNNWKGWNYSNNYKAKASKSIREQKKKDTVSFNQDSNPIYDYDDDLYYGDDHYLIGQNSLKKDERAREVDNVAKAEQGIRKEIDKINKVIDHLKWK